jgi:hypothetical protein
MQTASNPDTTPRTHHISSLGTIFPCGYFFAVGSSLIEVILEVTWFICLEKLPQTRVIKQVDIILPFLHLTALPNRYH